MRTISFNIIIFHKTFRERLLILFLSKIFFIPINNMIYLYIELYITSQTMFIKKEFF